MVIHYREYDGQRIRAWLPTWSHDTFEVIDKDEWEAFCKQARKFNLFEIYEHADGQEWAYGDKPEGWRFLGVGEIIVKGDKTYHVSDCTYIPCEASVGRYIEHGDENKFIRELP